MFTSNTTTNPDVPEKSLHIKQDDKFFSKLLTRETANNPSFRIYNGGGGGGVGGGGSVPFIWESRPGTPKYKLCDDTLPPLTPPPSYYYFNSSNKKPIKKNTRSSSSSSSSSLFYSLFPRINLRNNRKLNVWFPTPLSSVMSSWSSSNSSSSSSSSVSSSLYSVAADYEEVDGNGSPGSVLCFGMNRGFVCHFGAGCKK